MKCVFAVENSENAIPLPMAKGKPKDRAFYPLAVSAKRYFNLLYRARSLKFGAGGFYANVGGSFGRFASDTRTRHLVQPGDERKLALYPGACNFTSSVDGDLSIGGEMQIGWCGGTPIFKSPDGSWPPVPAGAIDFQPYGAGRCYMDAPPCVYEDGDTVYPFIHIWFEVQSDNPGENNTPFYFTASNFEFFEGTEDDYTLSDAETQIELFGWGMIPLYKLQPKGGPQTSVFSQNGPIKIEAASFYEYADADGKNPIYNGETGKRVGQWNMVSSLGPLID